MFGFFSAAQRRKLCTARWPSIWYLLFIATLSFSWQKMTPGTVWPGLRVATFYELTDILLVQFQRLYQRGHRYKRRGCGR